MVVIGYAVPHKLKKEYSSVQSRLVPHTQRCGQWILRADGDHNDVVVGAIYGLGMFYANQGKLREAEKMYVRALEGYEKAFARGHISTLDTVNNLGVLYMD